MTLKNQLKRTTAWTSLALFTLAPLTAGAETLDLAKAQAPAVKLGADNAALALQNAFIDVAATVGPAVVNISSEWTEDVQGFGNMNDFFNYWFYGPNGGSARPEFKQKRRSLGSGFIVAPDGTIVTNAHVVAKAEKITVTFEDGTTYPAKVLGKDVNTDIAVIKIEGAHKSFPTVSLGDSDVIKVGEWAIAIGNPFALDHTVTTGVISAKGRSVEIGGEDGRPRSGAQSYIQTDASINPGNSGGPLCDIQGQVIGINSAIYSQSGGSIGIGFAIPINLAKKVADDLVNKGKVIRAGLGAVVQSLTPQMAKSFGLSSTEGALISSVNPGSAAEKAGLKPGDIVLALNDELVDSSSDLVTKLYNFAPGDVVHLTVLRGGSQTRVRVTLETLKDTGLPGQEDQSQDNAGPTNSTDLGLSFQDQTPEIRQQLPSNAPKGPVVTGVQPDSAAAASGLQPGDVILKVGERSVASARQLEEALKKADLKDGVRLFVWHNGVTVYAFLQDGD